MEDKETYFSIRLNQNEKNLIEAKASKFRMKPSSFVRSFVIDTDRFVTNELKIENQKLKDEVLQLSKKIEKISEQLNDLSHYIVKASALTSIYIDFANSDEKKSAFQNRVNLDLEDAKAKKILK